MTPLHSVERELAAHAGALRALARDLVGRDDADDLVQETALRALRAPPAQPSGLGGWLRTILCRLAGNHLRARTRRRRREAAAAAAESLPAVDDTLARRDSLRAVTLALLSLPEPYQSTLLQRYFEGRSPAAIARRAGVPVATVKSRLQRGLAQLRARLDRNDPERRWQPALASATGLLLPVSQATLIGSLLMAQTAKLTLCAAALVAGALLWWQFAPRGEAPPAPLSAAPLAPAPGPGDAGGQQRQEAPQRETAGLDHATLAGLEHPFGYTLHCRVVDRDGLPVSGAHIAFAPPACAMNRWPEDSDADGRVTLRWRGRVPSMRMTLGVVGEGLTQGLVQLDVQAGIDAGITLLGQEQRGIRFRLVSRQGNDGQLAFSLVADGSCPGKRKGEQDCRSCHAEAPTLRGLFDDRLQVRAGLHPDATFADLLLPAAPQPAAAAERVAGRASIALDRLAARGQVSVRGDVELVLGDGLKLAVPGAPAHAATGTVTGTVFGEDGKPVADALVVWGTETDRPRGRARTNQDGRYRLEHVEPGKVEIRAGGRDDGLGRAFVQVGAGGETPAAVNLQRQATIRGRAIGKDGAALAGWRVDYESLAGTHADAAQVRKDGTFVLPNLPGGPGRLLLWPKDDPRLPVAIEPSVLPDTGEVLFDLGRRGEPLGGLRLRVELPAGIEQLRAEVRAFQVDSQRGASMVQTKDGAFGLDKLPAGFYQVEIGAESVGWVDLGQQWVDGKGSTDLGIVRLGAPATLELAHAPADQPFELYLRRDDGDLRVAPDVGPRAELRLPGGRWLALWRDPTGAVHRREFALQSGLRAELDLQGDGR